MFVVVSEQVVKRESVVASDEIDGRAITAPISVVNIFGTGDSSGKSLCKSAVAFQKSAHVVAVSAVPFSPATVRGEMTDFKPSRLKIMGKRFKQRRIAHGRAVLIASENCRQIKSEAVNAISPDPIAQTIEN